MDLERHFQMTTMARKARKMSRDNVGDNMMAACHAKTTRQPSMLYCNDRGGKGPFVRTPRWQGVAVDGRIGSSTAGWEAGVPERTCDKCVRMSASWLLHLLQPAYDIAWTPSSSARHESGTHDGMSPRYNVTVRVLAPRQRRRVRFTMKSLLGFEECVTRCLRR